MASVTASLPLSAVFSSRLSSNVKRKKQLTIAGNFNHLGQIVRKDIEFLKKGINKGMRWVSESPRFQQISKTFDDLLWLRTLEDPEASTAPFPPWPQPCYPELSGVDLFMADLKALEAYASYVYHLSKIWSRPLPEIYNPEEVAEYFSCRPHLVALRLIEVFSSFAFAAIKLRILGTVKFDRSGVDKGDTGNISEYYTGSVLKETMLNLGPTFVKVGQSLSTRPDILGSEFSKALSELHDQIPPFPRNVAMQIIEEELGSPIGTFFSYISEEPVAAASFGQVYRGVTLDGINVAVKVQRPNLLHVVVRDVYIIRLGLGLLQKVAKRKTDPRLYADELGRGLVGELDYTIEATNAYEFMEAHSSFPCIFVPKVFRHLTRKKVLTMEWVVGESPNDLVFASSGSSLDHKAWYSERQQLEAKRRLLDLVEKGVEATLIQLLETGLLHADPHPGNLRYMSEGRIGFLDFGLLCRMEKKHQFAMLASIIHIVNGDWAALVHALADMDIVRPGTNVRRVTMDLEEAIGEVELRDGIPDIKFSRVLAKIWSVALKYQFRMPPYYVLLLRSLASFEGLALATDEGFKTFESAYPYVVQKLLTDNSFAMRRILHSVVFNRRKEFQWQKLALFLRVGTTRKALRQFVVPSNDTSINYTPNGDSGIVDVANLVLRLLVSKDGAVLRRLLMTADGASLVRAMVSKEAILFRQQLTRSLADVINQWLSKVLGWNNIGGKYYSGTRYANGPYGKDVGPTTVVPSATYEHQSILSDRRMKVILYKILVSVRKHPVLMVRLCWSSLVMFVSASALACHMIFICWSETYLGSLSFSPRQYAISS